MSSSFSNFVSSRLVTSRLAPVCATAFLYHYAIRVYSSRQDRTRRLVRSGVNSSGPLPPAPVITRWTTWLSAALFYCKHWTKFCQVIERLDEDEAQSICKVKNVIQKTTVNQDLAFIKSHLKFIISCKEHLEKKSSI